MALCLARAILPDLTFTFTFHLEIRMTCARVNKHAEWYRWYYQATLMHYHVMCASQYS